MSLGHLPLSTVPLSTLATTTGAGTIQPAILTNGSQLYSPVIRLRLTAAAFSDGDTFYGPTVAAGGIRPSFFSNAQSFFSPTLRLTLKPIAFAGAQSFFAPRIVRVGAPALYSNAAVFFGPRLTLRIASSVYGNSQVFQAAAVVLPGVKAAPSVSSGGSVFAPSVSYSVSIGFAPGAVGAGVWAGDRAPRQGAQRKATAWPNLPTVAEAPPWRLAVVTPEIARRRARAQLMWRKRAEQLRRKRAVDRRVDRVVEDLIDEEIARTVVRLVKEDA